MKYLQFYLYKLDKKKMRESMKKYVLIGILVSMFLSHYNLTIVITKKDRQKSIKNENEKK